MLILVGGCSVNSEPPAPKAVFVIVDGIPADTVERVATPNIDQITRTGGYTRSWVGGDVGTESESPTVSAVGYNSLLTGTWANKHNVYSNKVRDPNYDYWDVFRVVKHVAPCRTTGLFSTWTNNRTQLLGNGLAEAGGDKLDYVADGFENDPERFPKEGKRHRIQRIDEHVVGEAARHIEDHDIDLSWVYIEYPDDVGHETGDGHAFDEAVRWADEQIGRLWLAVVERQRNHNEDWLLIVTTDHGRTAESTLSRRGRVLPAGANHGGQSVRERTTWIATNSQRLNTRFKTEPPIVDIMPSILAHLGVEIPIPVKAGLDGRTFIKKQPIESEQCSR